MRSLIRYGFSEAGFAVTFRNAMLMLFNMSILPLTVSLNSASTCCVISATQLLLKGDQVCCGDHARSRFASADAVVAAVVAEFREPSSGCTHGRAYRRSAYHVVNGTLFWWHDLRQLECVGASMTSACRIVCTVQE